MIVSLILIFYDFIYDSIDNVAGTAMIIQGKGMEGYARMKGATKHNVYRTFAKYGTLAISAILYYLSIKKGNFIDVPNNELLLLLKNGQFETIVIDAQKPIL
jgi:hypothetical protein